MVDAEHVPDDDALDSDQPDVCAVNAARAMWHTPSIPGSNVGAYRCWSYPARCGTPLLRSQGVVSQVRAFCIHQVWMARRIDQENCPTAGTSQPRRSVQRVTGGSVM